MNQHPSLRASIACEGHASPETSDPSCDETGPKLGGPDTYVTEFMHVGGSSLGTFSSDRAAAHRTCPTVPFCARRINVRTSTRLTLYVWIETGVEMEERHSRSAFVHTFRLVTVDNGGLAEWGPVRSYAEGQDNLNEPDAGQGTGATLPEPLHCRHDKAKLQVCSISQAK